MTKGHGKAQKGKARTDPSSTNQMGQKKQMKSVHDQVEKINQASDPWEPPRCTYPGQENLRAAQLLALTDVEPVFFKAAR